MPPPPTDPELALAARTWRLAMLATAEPDAARQALAALAPVPPEEPLSIDRIDRLAIQAIRRIVPPARRRNPDESAPAFDPAAPPKPTTKPTHSLGPAHRVIAGLPLQAAEAFILRRLDDLDPIRACRAMDCSRSAADRFLERADAALASAFGPDGAAAALRELRTSAESLAPSTEVVATCLARAHARHKARVTTWLAAIAASLLVVFLVLAAIAAR